MSASKSDSQHGHVYSSTQVRDHSVVVQGDVHSPTFNIQQHAAPTVPQRIDVMEVLKYTGMDVKRQFTMSSDFKSFDFEWVWTTDVKAWFTSSNNIFWICGKPGSGKSTLVAYLVNSARSINHLSENGNVYEILHFFYDYRAGKALANDIAGMLRMLLYQLADRFDSVKKILQELFDQHRIDLESPDNLVEAVSTALRRSKANFCIFVDGLDEYEGDYIELLQTLRQIRDRGPVKLCLASRPEADVPEIFRGCPEIRMQDYNKDSMKAYAYERKLQAKRDNYDVDQRCLPKMVDDLVDKAQGIVLWFKLAFDELLLKCKDDLSQEQIQEYVADVPVGLDALYERIVTSISALHTQEAALLLFLVQEITQTRFDEPRLLFDGQSPQLEATSLDFLWEVYNFIADSHGIDVCLKKLDDVQALIARVKHLLRGLIEIIPMPGDRHRSCTRLIHLSFTAWLAKSNWSSDHLHPSIHKVYHNAFCLRFFSEVLARYSADSVISTRQLEQALPAILRCKDHNKLDEYDFEGQMVHPSMFSRFNKRGRGRCSCCLNASASMYSQGLRPAVWYNLFEVLLSKPHTLKASAWQKYTKLLGFSCANILYLASVYEGQSEDHDSTPIILPIMQTPLVTLLGLFCHGVVCQGFKQNLLLSISGDDRRACHVFRLALAARYHIPHFFRHMRSAQAALCAQERTFLWEAVFTGSAPTRCEGNSTQILAMLGLHSSDICLFLHYCHHLKLAFLHDLVQLKSSDSICAGQELHDVRCTRKQSLLDDWACLISGLIRYLDKDRQKMVEGTLQLVLNSERKNMSSSSSDNILQEAIMASTLKRFRGGRSCITPMVMFIALVNVGVDSVANTTGNDTLKTMLDLRRRRKLKHGIRKAIPGIGDSSYQDELFALEFMIQCLEHYKMHRTWPRDKISQGFKLLTQRFDASRRRYMYSINTKRQR